MKKTIKDIIEMKKNKMSPFENQYIWFFQNLENNAISKSNGVKRNVTVLNDFDQEAQEYIIHQLYIMNKQAASDLIGELSLKEPFVSDEYGAFITKYLVS